jgi:DNA polymerase III epsilon subunit-like protein
MAPRWGGLRPEPYDPDARDADGDGIVQEQTAWERPAGTKLVDELGRAITSGSKAGARPRGMRVVDSNGKDVDYTPTYGSGPAGGKPGAATALSDHGAGSLGERGIPTVGEGLGKREGTSVRAITNPNPEPPKTEKPAKPKPPTEEKVVEGVNPTGFTATSADRPELTEPQKPRSPYKPSPPPLAGRAQELADEAEGDFKKFKELLDKEGYVVFDYETTGLQDGNIPVQIGAVRMKDGEIVERFNVFTNPRRPLSQWSKDNLKDKDGNPLTDEWLEGQTSLDEAHKQMAAFLGDSIIVAHNLPYDGEIIERMMKDADIDYKPSGSIDTLMLLRSAVPKGEGEDGPERHTLGALADFFDVDLGDAAHTADADSEAAALVLAKAMDWADQKKSDPEIFDATKQKELFDSATKKYDDQRKKYEADLDKYRSDMEEYQRSIAKADDVVSAPAPPQPEPVKPEPKKPDEPKKDVRLSGKLKNIKQRLTRKKIEKDVDPKVDGTSLSKDDFRKLVMEHGESNLPKNFWKMQVKVKDANGNVVVKDINRDSKEMDLPFGVSPESRNAKIMASHLVARRMREDGFDVGTLREGSVLRINSSTGTVFFQGRRRGGAEAEERGEDFVVDMEDPLYAELFAEASASELIRYWTDSSSMISNPDQRALQDAAHDHFSLATEKYGDGEVVSGNPYKRKADQAIREAFVQAMHDETQEMFARAGITHVRVYRGVSINFSGVTREDVMDPTDLPAAMLRDHINRDSGSADGGSLSEVPVRLRSMSSFSSDKDIAEDFNEMQGGMDRSSKSVVISTTIPVERVLATPGTGLGCLGESELVVLGAGPDDKDKFDMGWEGYLINEDDLSPDVRTMTEDDLTPGGDFNPQAFLATLSPEVRQRLTRSIDPNDLEEVLYDLWSQLREG